MDLTFLNYHSNRIAWDPLFWSLGSLISILFIGLGGKSQARGRVIAMVALVVLVLHAFYRSFIHIFVSRFGFERMIFNHLCGIAVLAPVCFVLSSKKMMRERAGRVLLVFSALWMIEFYVANFLIDTDMTGHSFTSRKWNERFWKPVNSLGYRDKEHGLPAVEGKKTLFVVGDSFVAGSGLKLVEERLSNRLGHHLGEKWDVLNLGIRGADTRGELHALKAHPRRPDGIILCYYINDISEAASDFGEHLAGGLPAPPFALRVITNNLHIANYFYWRLFMSLKMAHGYPATLARLFASADIWERHRQDLRQFIAYADGNDCLLIVVVFPHLADIKGTAPLTDKVASFFRSSGIQAIDLAPLLRDRPVRSLVVSAQDAHPNSILNQEIADLLLKLIVNSKLAS